MKRYFGKKFDDASSVTNNIILKEEISTKKKIEDMKKSNNYAKFMDEKILEKVSKKNAGINPIIAILFVSMALKSWITLAKNCNGGKMSEIIQEETYEDEEDSENLNEEEEEDEVEEIKISNNFGNFKKIENSQECLEENSEESNKNSEIYEDDDENKENNDYD